MIVKNRHCLRNALEKMLLLQSLSSCLWCSFILLLVACGTKGLDEDEDDLGHECMDVRPIWNKIYGRPDLALDKPKGNKLTIKWSPRAVLHGRDCVQAFEVEFQQFGLGRKRWSHWSSLVSCAFVVTNRRRTSYKCHKTLEKVDCDKKMKFRVLMHNIYHANYSVVPSVSEEAMIECKDIASTRFGYEDNDEDDESSENERDFIFYVRVPHDQPYKGKYRVTKIGTTTPRPRRTTTRRVTTLATASNSTTTTTTIKPPIIQAATNQTSDEKNRTVAVETSKLSSSSGHSERPARRGRRRSYFMLLPGNYSEIQTRKSYEVRHNLKNFTSPNNELNFCSRFIIYDMTHNCDDRSDIHRGMRVCFQATKATHLPDKDYYGQTKGNFRFLKDMACKGTFFYLNDVVDCSNECNSVESFIVV